MPDYDVNVTCTQCQEKHSAQIRIFLAHGPEGEVSLAEAFCNKTMSPSIHTLLNNTFCLCPKSGEKFRQSDPSQVFLIKKDYVADPSPEPDRTDYCQNQQSTDNLLTALANAFARHPELAPEERKTVADAIRRVARLPSSAQMVTDVLHCLLFEKAMHKTGSPDGRQGANNL